MYKIEKLTVKNRCEIPVGLYKEFIRHICNYANKIGVDINNG